MNSIPELRRACELDPHPALCHGAGHGDAVGQTAAANKIIHLSTERGVTKLKILVKYRFYGFKVDSMWYSLDLRDTGARL